MTDAKTPSPSDNHELLDLYRSTFGEDEPEVIDRRWFSFVSAAIWFNENGSRKSHFSGWITYLNGQKIKFVARTHKDLSLHFAGNGGHPIFSAGPDDLAGKTGTYALSGTQNVSFVRVYQNNILIYNGLVAVLGEGGQGHYMTGDVTFSLH